MQHTVSQHAITPLPANILNACLAPVLRSVLDYAPHGTRWCGIIVSGAILRPGGSLHSRRDRAESDQQKPARHGAYNVSTVPPCMRLECGYECIMHVRAYFEMVFAYRIAFWFLCHDQFVCLQG